MSDEIEIKVAIVVGDNGNFAAIQYRGEETDWGFLQDAVGVYDKKTCEMIYPKAEQRYIVLCHVPVPAVQTVIATSLEEVK